MSSTSGVGSTNSGSNSAASQVASFANLNANDFIKMMITELQNQDPTSPMDSSQILSELSQIGSITSSQQLQTTLQGLSTGQNLASTSALIGKGIEGLDVNGNSAAGIVNGVVVNNGAPELIVGTSNQAVTLSNITQVIDPAAVTGDTGTSNGTSPDTSGGTSSGTTGGTSSGTTGGTSTGS